MSVMLRELYINQSVLVFGDILRYANVPLGYGILATYYGDPGTSTNFVHLWLEPDNDTQRCQLGSFERRGHELWLRELPPNALVVAARGNIIKQLSLGLELRSHIAVRKDDSQTVLYMDPPIGPNGIIFES
jgi:hypothetical protein